MSGPRIPAPNLDKLLDQLVDAELRAAGVPADRMDIARLYIGKDVEVKVEDGFAVLQITDERGNPRVGGCGDLLTLPAFIAEKRAGKHAFLFGATLQMPDGDAKPEHAKLAETATEAAIRAKREADRTGREARQRERDAWPNPWMPGSFNLSRQMELENMNPARAKAAKAAAGVA